MSAQKRVSKTLSFGELVAMAFDVAAAYSGDPQEVARIAAAAVDGVLRRSRVAASASEGSSMGIKKALVRAQAQRARLLGSSLARAA